jgi:hypothetical protein
MRISIQYLFEYHINVDQEHCRSRNEADRLIPWQSLALTIVKLSTPPSMTGSLANPKEMMEQLVPTYAA